MAQWAVAMGKEREGELSSMGKAAATQPKPPADRLREKETETLAQSPTAGLKCRWRCCCQTSCERKHQKCFMRHKRHCGKGLKSQMWTNDPCRAELPRRTDWGAMVDSGAPRNFGMEMLRARATGRIYVPQHGEKHQACLSPVLRSPYKDRTILAASPTKSGCCPSPEAATCCIYCAGVSISDTVIQLFSQIKLLR